MVLTWMEGVTTRMRVDVKEFTEGLEVGYTAGSRIEELAGYATAEKGDWMHALVIYQVLSYQKYKLYDETFRRFLSRLSLFRRDSAYRCFLGH